MLKVIDDNLIDIISHSFSNHLFSAKPLTETSVSVIMLWLNIKYVPHR